MCYGTTGSSEASGTSAIGDEDVVCLTCPLKHKGDGMTLSLDLRKRNLAEDNPLVKTSAI
jgi:hypothetical protein